MHGPFPFRFGGAPRIRIPGLRDEEESRGDDRENEPNGREQSRLFLIDHATNDISQNDAKARAKREEERGVDAQDPFDPDITAPCVASPVEDGKKDWEEREAKAGRSLNLWVFDEEAGEEEPNQGEDRGEAAIDEGVRERGRRGDVPGMNAVDDADRAIAEQREEA